MVEEMLLISAVSLPAPVESAPVTLPPLRVTVSTPLPPL